MRLSPLKQLAKAAVDLNGRGTARTVTRKHGPLTGDKQIDLTSEINTVTSALCILL